MSTVGKSLGMALVVAIAGCATTPVERAAQSRPTGEQTVTIEMVRFTFEPEVVTLKAGTRLRITAASNSRIPHNITVLSLDRQVIKAVDIPPRANETFEVTVPKPGRYIFHCDKFLHRWPFRMEGTLVAQ